MGAMTPRAVIFGCAGKELSPAEEQFFRKTRPWGFILFARNCVSPAQIKKLCTDLRATVDDDTAPILIDQEGGRVVRLKPPVWPQRPPMDRFGALAKLDPKKATEAAFLGARLLAEDVASLGINVNCVPVLDLPQADGHEIIGDRALASQPEQVALLGREVIRGTLAGAVLPVIKHIPGHGRALADSHLELPVVSTSKQDLAGTDFAPFKALNDAPMAMTAHVIYTAYDRELPATLSTLVINDVIRGEIGFDGLLLTDDLSMKALAGPFEDRARAAIAAGCDMLLHCNGDMAEMEAISKVAPKLEGVTALRAKRARDRLPQKIPFKRDEAEKRFAELLKPVMV